MRQGQPRAPRAVVLPATEVPGSLLLAATCAGAGSQHDHNRQSADTVQMFPGIPPHHVF